MSELVPLIVVLAIIGLACGVYRLSKSGNAAYQAAITPPIKSTDLERSETLYKNLKLINQGPRGSKHQRELVEGMVEAGNGPSWLTRKHGSDIQMLMAALEIELMCTGDIPLIPSDN